MKRIIIFSILLAWVAVCGMLWSSLTEKKEPGFSGPSQSINLPEEEGLMN